MPITEKGYQPYEGKRLPSRRNHWVIAKMEAARIWSSALVKTVVILSFLPPVGYLLYGIVRAWLSPMSVAVAQAQGDTTDLAAELGDAFGADLVLSSMNTQLMFVVLMTLAWGAGTIAADARGRVMQFYFAKPVTTRSYLLGKIIPLAIYCSAISLLPALLMVVLEAVVLRSYDLWASRLALALPAALYAALVGAALSTCAVAMSSLSRSRLLTLSFWAAALFIPMAVAWVVELATRGEVDWPYLASLLSMVDVLGRAIFRLEAEGQIQWYHAIIVVLGLCVGSVFLMRYRLSRPEVIG